MKPALIDEYSNHSNSDFEGFNSGLDEIIGPGNSCREEDGLGC
jgi:hypothetical protein